jgi:hypothetical protein
MKKKRETKAEVGDRRKKDKEETQREWNVKCKSHRKAGQVLMRRDGQNTMWLSPLSSLSKDKDIVLTGAE